MQRIENSRVVMQRFSGFALIFFYFVSAARAQDSLAPCTCDLTRYSCNLDCCCDPDCTLDDKQTFSTCIGTYTYENALACSQSAMLYSNFTPYFSNTTSSNFLCVYFDKYPSRNYYVSPSVDASSQSSVSAAIATYQTSYGFSSVTSGLDPASLRTEYKTSVPVQVMYASGNITGFLAQPRPSNSPNCNYASPALFLDSSSSNCSRSVTSVTCEADDAIDMTSYVAGFRVARQPTVLNSRPDYNGADLISVNQSTLVCVDASGAAINCTGGGTPVLNTDGTCGSVLSQITYNINYDSRTGINSVTFDAVLRTVPVNTTYTLLQTFAFRYNFSSTLASDAYPRSGNPGYLTGRPLIAGRKNGTSVIVNSDPSRWVTLPGVNSDGSCAGSGTVGQSVLFGENLRSSCTRSLTWSSANKTLTAGACASLNAAVLASLAGLGVNGDMSLATFGNSSASQAGDWFSVIVDSCGQTPGQSSTACTNVILGATLELLVAKAGSLSYPQSKLVGARLSCRTGPILFQCAAGSCQATAGSIKFLTTSTVSFTDVSGSPLEGAKQRPVYLLRLPTDFFYPLYTYSRASGIGPGWQIWLLCIAFCTSLLRF